LAHYVIEQRALTCDYNFLLRIGKPTVWFD